MLVKWEFNSNPKLNYEYLLLDCTEKYERQYIHFKNLLWCEVDNEKDFAYLKIRSILNLGEKKIRSIIKILQVT